MGDITNVRSGAVDGSEADRVQPFGQTPETLGECRLICKADLLPDKQKIGHNVFYVDRVIKGSEIGVTRSSRFVLDAQDWVDRPQLAMTTENDFVSAER